jgi:hypothetical protein
MDTKEFRRGNFIYGIGKYSGTALSIDKIGEVWVGLERVDKFILPSQIERIPLGEEWLVNFGFKFTGDRGVYFKNKLELRRDDSDGKYLVVIFDQHWDKIEFVDQLQNLYFTLFKTELTLE